MRQSLGQGCGEDDHGCNPQIQWFDVLTLLEVNEILELECLKLYSTDSSRSVSRRVDLPTCQRTKHCCANWKCQLRPRVLVCAGGEFQVIFMLLAIDGAGRAIRTRMLAICGGFRSHLCFDDWTDLQCCRFSRQQEGEKLLLCATAQDLKAGRKTLRSQRIESETLIGRPLMDEMSLLWSWPGSVVPVPAHPAWRFENLMTTTQWPCAEFAIPNRSSADRPWTSTSKKLPLSMQSVHKEGTVTPVLGGPIWVAWSGLRHKRKGTKDAVNYQHHQSMRTSHPQPEIF